MKSALTLWSLAICLAAPANAQQQQTPQPTPPQTGQRRQAPAPSPDVQPDGRVTFRLRAPGANSVALHGEWTPETIAMTKDESGLWSTTVGPLPREVYAYSFTVDGVGIADPQNPVVKLAARGNSQSVVAIPGDPPRLHDPRDVPHGTVQENWYYSKTLNHELRHVFVYAPPGYDARSTAGYPVLVLLHGAGNAETNWESMGRANFIIDNLLAEKKVKPMLLVMPYGQMMPQLGADEAPNNALFEKDLLGDILPMVEANYRVAKGPRNRAIAGLSMGGMQALSIGLHNPDRFAWIGVYSSIMEPDFETRYAAQLAQPAALNKKLGLLWLSCGTQDNLYRGVQALDGTLTKLGITHEFHPTEGGRHSWVVWREYLEEMAPKLFR